SRFCPRRREAARAPPPAPARAAARATRADQYHSILGPSGDLREGPGTTGGVRPPAPRLLTRTPATGGRFRPSRRGDAARVAPRTPDDRRRRGRPDSPSRPGVKAARGRPSCRGTGRPPPGTGARSGPVLKVIAATPAPYQHRWALGAGRVDARPVHRADDQALPAEGFDQRGLLGVGPGAERP